MHEVRAGPPEVKREQMTSQAAGEAGPATEDPDNPVEELHLNKTPRASAGPPHTAFAEHHMEESSWP